MAGTSGSGDGNPMAKVDIAGPSGSGNIAESPGLGDIAGPSRYSGASTSSGSGDSSPLPHNNKFPWPSFLKFKKRNRRVYPQFYQQITSFMKRKDKRTTPQNKGQQDNQEKNEKFWNLFACFKPKVDKKMKKLLIEEPRRKRVVRDTEVDALIDLMENDINRALMELQAVTRHNLKSQFRNYAHNLLSEYYIHQLQVDPSGGKRSQSYNARS